MHASVLTALCVLLAIATVAQSRRWFAPEVNCWITQEKVPASWEDAQRFCEIDGAVLASPLNMQLFDYMQTLISEHNHSVAYFIGTRAKSPDYGQKVQFVSLEGRRLEEMPKAVFIAIEQLDLEQGDCLSMDRHGIRAVSCWDHLPYICYSNETTECGSAPATTPAPTTSAPATTTSALLPSTTMPPGYKYNSATSSFYKFHHESDVTWYSANATCASVGAQLVVLNNADEAHIVTGIVTVAFTRGSQCTWTGLVDNRPGGVMDWRTAHVADSRSWFAHEVSCWITQQKVPASWEDAQRFCEKHGAILASPLNTQLFNYMQFRISVHNHSAAYFIGTRARRSDDGQEVHYVSIEGRRLDNLPMDVFDAIEQLDLEQGDCLSIDRHGIRAVSCWDHLPYICYSNETTECGSALATTETPTTTASAPTTTTNFPPPGYTYKPATGSSYKFHNTQASWNDAKAVCASEGAHLLVVNNKIEASVVAGMVRGAGSFNDAWAGLRDARPGGASDWHTVHGEPLSEVFHEWYQGYPTKNPEHTCGGFSAINEQLFDWTCNTPFHFTCEISQ